MVYLHAGVACLADEHIEIGISKSVSTGCT